MTGSFADRVSAARSMHGPLVAGLDPSGELLEAWGLDDSAAGLERFVDIVVGAFAGIVGCVKPQSAFYERHGWEGIRALSRLIGECRSAGLVVIVTVEAGLLRDIGEINARLAPGRMGPIGAVIGPTPSEDDLDLAGAHGLFLAPGVGAQGATVADVARCFAACPERVLPSASRSLLATGPESRPLRDAAGRLGDQLDRALSAR